MIEFTKMEIGEFQAIGIRSVDTAIAYRMEKHSTIFGPMTANQHRQINLVFSAMANLY